jgi:hypothetical protein
MNIYAPGTNADWGGRTTRLPNWAIVCMKSWNLEAAFPSLAVRAVCRLLLNAFMLRKNCSHICPYKITWHSSPLISVHSVCSLRLELLSRKSELAEVQESKCGRVRPSQYVKYLHISTHTPNGFECAELGGITLQENCAFVSDVCVWSAVAVFCVDRRHSVEDVCKNTRAVYDESVRLLTAGLRNSQKDIRNWRQWQTSSTVEAAWQMQLDAMWQQWLDYRDWWG